MAITLASETQQTLEPTREQKDRSDAFSWPFISKAVLPIGKPIINSGRPPVQFQQSWTHQEQASVL